MNLTDKEKIMLSAAAEKVKKSCDRIYPEKALYEESNFAELTDTDFLNGNIITEYDFSTPVEFRKKMDELWERRNTPEMKHFSIPASVALFKNRPEQGKKVRKSDGKISGYIYEF